MNKLSILFAVASFATLLGGCPKKNDGDAKKEPAAKVAEDKVADPKAPDPVTPDNKATGDLPAECGEYKAMIDKLAACEKMPKESRDSLKQAYDASATAWANVPAEGKAQLATTCKQGAEALAQAAGSVCGW
jgi:hypothetical protein